MAISDSLNAETDRWFLWWPVGMGVGALLYFNLPFEPPLLPALFIFLGLVALFKTSLNRFFLCAFLSISVGFVAGKVRTEILSTPMLTHKVKDVFVTGVIKDIEHPAYKKGSKRRIILTDVVYEDSIKKAPHALRLNIADHFIEGKPGDRVRCFADLIPISYPLSLHGYDFQIQAYFAGIGAVGRVKKACSLTMAAPRTFLSRIRYQLTQTLRHAMPGPTGQIAAALVTGDKSGIPKDIRQNFTDAGIAHILAISGLHISLVAGLIFLVMRRGFSLIPFLAERFFIKKWAAVVAIFTTGGYLAISGFGFPAQRAFFMTALVMIGVCLDRTPLSMRSLSLAATVILCFFPESILSISFQLSFAAVIGLVAVFEGGWTPLRIWISSGPWWRKYLDHGFGIMTTTLVATLATTPLIISTFNRFTLQALAGNLLAIPLTSLWIMPMAALALLSLLFGEFSWLFKIWHYGLSLLVVTADKIAHLPGSVILVATPYFPFLMLTTLGGLWFCLWKGRWRLWGLGLIALGIPFLFYDHHPGIYVTEDVIAYRSGKTLKASSLKRGKFALDIWVRELGLTKIEPWDTQVTLYLGYVTLLADPYLENGKKRDYSETTAFIQKHCTQTPWLVSNGYAWKACRDKMDPSHIIDRYQLRRKGPHFLSIHNQQIDVISAQQHFGKRPWRVVINNKKRD